MKYSMNIGRVGALAVALGVGAAVATSPGIAFAQETDSDTSNVGAESTSNPPADETQAEVPGAGDLSGGGEEDGTGPVTEPPAINVGGSTVDTSTNDDNAGAGDDEQGAEEQDLEDEEETEEEDSGEEQVPAGEELPPAPAGNDGSQGLAGGSGGSGTQQGTQTAQGQQLTAGAAVDDGATVGTQRNAVAAQDDNNGVQSLRAITFDDSQASSEAGTFSALSVVEAEPVAQDPISALITLPLHLVTDVLSAVLGGIPGAPGENPLLLGVLAFVRRQFSIFERTFENQAPVIDDYSLVENPDGTFTVTVDTEEPDVDAFDPDGDDLTFSATNGSEGTVAKTGANTFVYTPGEDFDGDDEFTLSVSDTGGLFGANRKTDTITVVVEAGDQDPTQPEDPQPPVLNEDGTAETELQFDAAKVESVSIAPGFEPKYWTVQETYNPDTGLYEATLTPTQAGQLRAALGLDTTDSYGLQVTTTETQTVQTFALRSASFAALAEEPDYTVNLPEVPAGHFATRAPIVTSPDAEDSTQTFPAGTVVTDRYAYVLNSNLSTGNPPTLSVIGADPDKAGYLQVMDEIEVNGTALLLTQAGDRVYIASNSSLQVIDTDGIDPISEADDNALLAPIDLGEPGGIIPVASPDGKKLYVINQQSRKIFVVDTDPANTATYHTVVDEIVVADPPTMVDNGDGTRTVSGQFPLSAAFNADGTRMYLVRDGQAYTQNIATNEISNFTFSGEIITIDTTTNEVIGTPLPLEGDYGYFASSDGKYLYVPTLTMNGFDPMVDTDITQITGSVNVIDVQDPDNPVIVANLPTGNMPVNVAFSPDKSLAYVVDAGEGTVWVIDTVNQEVLDIDRNTVEVDGLVFDAEPSATLGQVFNVIAASPDGTRLFVTNYGKGTVIPLEFVQDVV